MTELAPAPSHRHTKYCIILSLCWNSRNRDLVNFEVSWFLLTAFPCSGSSWVMAHLNQSEDSIWSHDSDLVQWEDRIQWENLFKGLPLLIFLKLDFKVIFKFWLKLWKLKVCMFCMKLWKIKVCMFCIKLQKFKVCYYYQLLYEFTLVQTKIKKTQYR